MRVLVTGGTGFLGKYVCDELARHGHIPRAEGRHHDLTDPTQAAAMFDDIGPDDAVIHLAAEVGGIGANQANPGRFFYANLAMGLNVLEQARIHDVAKLVMVGTVCAYPKHTPTPFKETAIWDGYPEETNAPYGVAKRSLLTGCHAYRDQYSLNAIYLLPVNLYGPGDNFDPASSHVIPALIRKFCDAKDSNAPEVMVWGDGSAYREFLHVKDAARGIVLALERYNGAEPVNVGSGRELSIWSLAHNIATVVGYEGKIVWESDKPNGQPRRRLDVSRAHDWFGFKAEVGLREGLVETVAWWRGQS